MNFTVWMNSDPSIFENFKIVNREFRRFTEDKSCEAIIGDKNIELTTTTLNNLITQWISMRVDSVQSQITGCITKTQPTSLLSVNWTLGKNFITQNEPESLLFLTNIV